MGKDETLLTVLVTTYNRKPYLEKIIKIFSGYIEKGLKFKMLVSDDCSSDGTKEMCERLVKDNAWLAYYCLDKNSGMDANFRNAYIHCGTKYCWLLGDHRYIDYDELKNILKTLAEGKYDALILRTRYKLTLKSKVYDDINNLFREIGYNVTNNASCVIPTAFYKEELYNRYKGTTFLHMGIFLENISQKEYFKIKFISEIYVKSIDIDGLSDVGWLSHPFLNFGKYWVNFVYSLPPCITAINKSFVLKQHNKITKLFSIGNIIQKRIKYNDIIVNSYKEGREYMKYASDTPLWVFDLLLLWIPGWPYKLIWKIYKKLHH